MLILWTFVGTLFINSDWEHTIVYTKEMEVYGQMVSPQGPTISEGKAIETNSLCLAYESLYDANIWLF